MPNDDVLPRFTLLLEGDGEWVIQDESVPPGDPAHLVARIREDSEADVRVEWMLPIPLPEHYLTAEFAADDLRMWNQRRQGWSRPIPIPHIPPLQLDKPSSPDDTRMG